MKYPRWNTEFFTSQFKTGEVEEREIKPAVNRVFSFIGSLLALSLFCLVVGFLLGCFVMGCHLAVELLETLTHGSPG